MNKNILKLTLHKFETKLQALEEKKYRAKQLIKLLYGLKVKINLIPYNPKKTFSTSSSENQINLFTKYLRSKNIMITIRRRKGKK